MLACVLNMPRIIAGLLFFYLVLLVLELSPVKKIHSLFSVNLHLYYSPID